MRILSIETSCDETAVSIVEATGTFPHANYKVLGNSLFSQIDIHREYGGVFPAVAKREHVKTLVPMLMRALKDAAMLLPHEEDSATPRTEELYTLLTREEGLADALIHFLLQYEKPDVDLIAVTHGPGLEPTLWVGINFAKALSYAWGIPVVPINHMEGHILASIFDGHTIPDLVFPAVSLLISGGHTELILIREWGEYARIGETRDDAVGEAFDKTARMLGLPYPGGPEISNLARDARKNQVESFVQLPRPMLESGDYDFSFSGLKTAVRYAVQDKTLSHNDKIGIAREFEEAVTAVLLRKTKNALMEYNAQTLIVGGGVSANTYIRETFKEFFWKEYPMVTVYLPPRNMSTDNSIMIALVGHAKKDMALSYDRLSEIKADGNLELGV